MRIPSLKMQNTQSAIRNPVDYLGANNFMHVNTTADKSKSW